MDILSFLDADVSAAPERRRANRYTLPLAVVIRADGIELQTRAEDFSLTGFRISSPVVLPIGAKVHVYCRSKRRRQATVAWQRKDQIGFSFHRMLNPDQMQAWFDE